MAILHWKQGLLCGLLLFDTISSIFYTKKYEKGLNSKAVFISVETVYIFTAGNHVTQQQQQ